VVEIHGIAHAQSTGIGKDDASRACHPLEERDERWDGPHPLDVNGADVDEVDRSVAHDLICDVVSVGHRPTCAWAVEHQNVASGFAGLPVAPTQRRGASVNRNSQRP